ncbi:biotin-dependent carboxyltransferase family protein [Microtetraspora malaysiensis]|uniref:5-oxoprolinase subunit C family protein n=1 Tax=Microtetraspora malaysiensis TaxID=161358 RepID=UPI003D8F350E
MIEVLEPGMLTTVQDLGRPGWAHLGVPPSGALDLPAFTLANRLVGNAEGAAALETTLRGPTLRFHRSATIAVTGAPVTAHTRTRPIAMNAVEFIAAGDILTVGWALTGARTYIAIRNGLRLPLTLGSVSTDLLTGLGPPPLATGTCIPFGTAAVAMPVVDLAPVARLTPSPRLAIIPGPREDWFTATALDELCGTSWTIGPDSNRVGLRLQGPPLTWSRDAELLSEGITAGALQVPPSGRPILLLRDHPATGGYPVIAVLQSDYLHHAAQLPPGSTIRFAMSSRT